MDALFLGIVRHESRLLIRRMRIRTIGSLIDKRLAMLPLPSSDHVHGLLAKIEIILIELARRLEIEVTINEVLTPRIEQRIYVSVIPSSALNRLEFRIQIVQPTPNIKLRRL